MQSRRVPLLTISKTSVKQCQRKQISCLLQKGITQDDNAWLSSQSRLELRLKKIKIIGVLSICASITQPCYQTVIRLLITGLWWAEFSGVREGFLRTTEKKLFFKPHGTTPSIILWSSILLSWMNHDRQDSTEHVESLGRLRSHSLEVNLHNGLNGMLDSSVCIVS